MSGGRLLTVNPGSSGIKLGLFELDGGRAVRVDGAVAGLAEGAEAMLQGIAARFALAGLAAVGHRVVHGGGRFAGACVIDEASLAAIAALEPLAPLHQPRSVALIRALRGRHPGLPQTASFDTAFHRTQPALVRRYAIPRGLHAAGIRRYGFHGLSYASVAARLAVAEPALARGRVVAAHLGSGASLCALRGGRSRDSSMGFSTLDGVPMATRCGALDPGVVLHLLRRRGLDAAAVEALLYRRSGLLGVSGLSGDARVLLASGARPAREAMALFAFRAAREAVALAQSIGGLDALVFTGGIGEHQPAVRAAICRHLEWLGVALDAGANAAGAGRLEAAGSRAAILVLPADEEQVIADECLAALRGAAKG